MCRIKLNKVGIFFVGFWGVTSGHTVLYVHVVLGYVAFVECLYGHLWLGIVKISDLTNSLFELLQKLGSLEVIGNCLVVTGDDLINLLFPRGLHVFPTLDGHDELPKGGFYYRDEMVRNLKQKTGVTRGSCRVCNKKRTTRTKLAARTWSDFIINVWTNEKFHCLCEECSNPART